MARLHYSFQNGSENDIKSTHVTFQTGAYYGDQYQKLSFINEVIQNYHYKNKLITTLWSQGRLNETKESEGCDNKDPRLTLNWTLPFSFLNFSF